MVKLLKMNIIRWSVAYVPFFWSIYASLYPDAIKKFFSDILNDYHLIPIWHWHIFIAFIFTLIIYISGIKFNLRLENDNIILQDENKILKNDIDSLSLIFKQCGGVYLEEIWIIFLTLIYEENKFSRDERISLYCYNDESEHFIMLARYSKNPELKSKGSGVYKAREGCIWKGWTNGTSCINGLPDYTDNKSEYLKQMKSRGNISRATMKSLHMKPRSIGSFSINDFSNKAIAVVVIESNIPEKINNNLIHTISMSKEINNIRHILTRFSSFLPKTGALKEKGF